LAEASICRSSALCVSAALRWRSARAARVARTACQVGNGNAAEELHHEVRAARVGRAGVEDAGDVGVVHHRQRLAFRFEARDDLPAVHARLDDLQRYLAAHRVVLLGHVHHAHPTAADLLQEPVGADHRAGLVRR
jgi:hypothetical protein